MNKVFATAVLSHVRAVRQAEDPFAGLSPYP